MPILCISETHFIMQVGHFPKLLPFLIAENGIHMKMLCSSRQFLITPI